MKTLSTLLVSIFSLATVNAKEIASNLEITSSAVMASTSLKTGASLNSVVLNWTAKNETNNTRYEIERSFFSNYFTAIAAMQIPFAISNSNNYSINDNATELTGRKIVYYRVKQIAADGTIRYSNITVVSLESSTQFIASKITSINFTAMENGNAVIKIMGVTGNTVKVKNTIAAKGNNTIELQNDLPKGIYTAVISVNGVVTNTKKLIAE